MMISNIRDYIVNNKGNVIKFRLDNGRNQIQEFYGEILNTYKAIFIIKLFGSGMIRSFSYADVLIGNLMVDV